MGYFTPETVTPERPRGIRGEILEVRSYHLTRVVIGVLGIALPLVLVVGDLLFLDGEVKARGSLSAYYHSGMRDAFVGVLVVTGIFLVTYKLFRRSLENTASVAAGIAALGVAFFPTGTPEGVHLTPLQSRLGEGAVQAVHFTAAAIFIMLLAVISYFFAVREGRRLRERDGSKARFSPHFWRRFHLSATGLIVLSIVFIVVTKASGFLDEHSLLIGETVAAWAFGASWLAKGFELQVLRASVAGPGGLPGSGPG